MSLFFSEMLVICEGGCMLPSSDRSALWFRESHALKAGRWLLPHVSTGLTQLKRKNISEDAFHFK